MNNASARAETRPSPPRRGRRAMLSREAITDAGVQLLDTIEVEAFTLAKLAEWLGVSIMSLYTYYPTRDAVLDAIAMRLFSLFKCPLEQPTWQGKLEAWLWALEAHFRQYPMATKVIVRNGRIAESWPGVWLPVMRIFHERGLRGRPLAMTFSWFLNTAVGFIFNEQHWDTQRQHVINKDFHHLPSDDQKLLLEAWPELLGLELEARYQFGFARLIETVDRIIADGQGVGECPSGEHEVTSFRDADETAGRDDVDSSS